MHWEAQSSTMQSMVNLNCQLSQAKQDLAISDDNFIGIFLYGSQNYGLDYEESDADSILIVHSADKSKQELSTPTGKVKIYTLKYFIYKLKQGDLECYEILYTKYKILNPVYENSFMNFIKEFSEYMSYERIKNSLITKLDEHLCHVLWMMINKENARYNKKRLYWAIRVCNQLQRINDGESFESSLVYRDLLGCDLMQIKTVTNYLSIKEFSAIYKHLIEFIHSQHRYSRDILDSEEKCLSSFYTNITELYSNYMTRLGV